MALILFVTLLSPLCAKWSLLNFLAEEVHVAHRWCLNQIPPEAVWSDLYASLICGAPLHNGELAQPLKSLGLIHLAVVSGAHLLVVEKLIFIATKPFPRARSVVIPLGLIGYAMTCELQAPVVRALVQLGLYWISKKRKWNWSKPQLVFAAGCFCLMLMPSWWNSYSLLLSWGASLALTIKGSTFKQCFYVFLVLIPILLPLGLPHPISVVANFTLAPLLCAVAFPMSVLAVIFPILITPTDAFWTVTATLLQEWAFTLPLTSFETVTVAKPWLWIYLLALNFLFDHQLRTAKEKI